MKIRDILNYVKSVDTSKFSIAEDFVAAGYGQTKGGYMKQKPHRKPSQLEHFVNYYDDKRDKLPSFASLWCPELMLFIAEIFEVPRENIVKARDIVAAYEDEYDLRNTEKKATYLSPQITRSNVLSRFKKALKIYELNEILKNSSTIEEAKRLIIQLR